MTRALASPLAAAAITALAACGAGDAGLGPTAFDGAASAAVAPAAGDGGAWTARAVDAAPLALFSNLPAETRLDELNYMGGLELTADHAGFGGLSALACRDGLFYFGGDRGALYRARLIEDEDGRLIGAEQWARRPAPLSEGVSRIDWNKDLESLALGEDGRLAIAFERAHRIVLADPDAATAARISGLDALRDQPINTGVEALARLPSGRLLAMSEDADDEGLTRAWSIGGAGDVDMMSYRGSADFAPTAADALGERLFVLERSIGLLSGWRAKLAVVDLAAEPEAGDQLEGRVLATLSRGVSVDNMEGLTARPGPDGAVDLYLVSDDNFSPLQRTILMKFRWRPSETGARLSPPRP